MRIVSTVKHQQHNKTMSNQAIGLIDLNAKVESTSDNRVRPPRLPYDVYKFRIKEEPEFVAESKSSGKPMLVFKVEVCGPDAIQIPEGTFDPKGEEFTVFCSLAPGATGNLKRLHQATGLPTQIQLNQETGLPIDISYTGKEFFAPASSATEEQVREDKTPILNPHTGKPLTRQQKQMFAIITPE